MRLAATLARWFGVPETPSPDLRRQLERDLGRDRCVYAGPSIGRERRLCIGVGHVVDRRSVEAGEPGGLDDEVIDLQLDRDIERGRQRVFAAYPWARGLSEPRLGVLIGVALRPGLCTLGSTAAMGMMEQGDFTAAARAMLSTPWSHEEEERAERLALQLVTDRWV